MTNSPEKPDGSNSSKSSNGSLRETVAELRRLDAEATPGPLPEPLPNRTVVLPWTRSDLPGHLVVRFQLCSDADAKLFVAARNALGQLCDAADENERLRALLGEAARVLEDVPGDEWLQGLRDRIEAALRPQTGEAAALPHADTQKRE